MKKRTITKIFAVMLCVLLLLGSTLLVGCNTVEEETSSTAELVKAVRVVNSMAAGSSVSIKNVELVEVYSDQLPEGYATRVIDVLGKRLNVDVVAGDFLAESMLEKSPRTPETTRQTARMIT